MEEKMLNISEVIHPSPASVDPGLKTSRDRYRLLHDEDFIFDPFRARKTIQSFVAYVDKADPQWWI